MQLSPVSATQIGDHRYDSELDDLSAAGQQKTVAAYKALLGELDKIAVAKLGRENQVDAAILRNQLQSEIWNAEVLQSGKWDPQLYNGVAGSAIYGLMAREFAPLPERLKAATARMEKLPAIFAQARENWTRPACRRSTPRPLPSRTRASSASSIPSSPRTSANCRRPTSSACKRPSTA